MTANAWPFLESYVVHVTAAKSPQGTDFMHISIPKRAHLQHETLVLFSPSSIATKLLTQKNEKM